MFTRAKIFEYFRCLSSSCVGNILWFFQIWNLTVTKMFNQKIKQEVGKDVESHFEETDSSSSLEIRFFGVKHRCRSVSLVVCWRNSKVILTVFKIQNGGETKFKSSILVLSCSKSPLADFTPTGKKAAEIDCITTCFSFCYCYSEREAKKTSAENRQDGRLCLKMFRKRFKWKWRQKNSRTYNQRMKPDRNFQEGKIQSKSAVRMKAAKISKVSISFEAQKSTFS